MMATIVSLMIAGAVWFLDIVPAASTIPWLAAGVGGLFLLLLVLANLMYVQPLQWAEVRATPRVVLLMRADSSLRWLGGFLTILPVISFAIAAGAISELWASTATIFSAWLVLVGLSIDLLRIYYTRIGSYLIPSTVVQNIVVRAQADIAQGRDLELCDWMATLTEVALMSLSRQGSSLAERSVSGISALLQRFLEVHRRSLQTETSDAKVHQRASYVLFYGMERLQLIHHRALADDLESVCSHVVTSLGKVAVAAAHGDISKVSYPIHYMGSLALTALSSGLSEVPVKANLTLVEVGKLILTEVDLSKAVVRDPMVNLVTQLEEIAKATFRRDKDSNISVLTQPLRDLKASLQSHALADRSDVKAVVAAIDAVLSDFDNLQLVLRTLPTIPDVPVTDEGLPEIPELAKAARANAPAAAPSAPAAPSK